MRPLLLPLLTLACLAQDAPNLLLNSADVERVRDWSGRMPWAAAQRDAIVQSAASFPAAHLTRYGLREWSVPPEGGQWTHWYVCPTHGNGLQFQPPSGHVCPVDNRRWTDTKYDQVIYTRRNSDNANSARDLALAYRMTGDAGHARKAATILLAYADAYTTWPIHDTNGRIDARTGGRQGAQTLDDAVWIIPMAWAYDLIAATLTAEERGRIVRGLLDAAIAVIRRNDATRSNWQSWHNAGIAAAAFAAGNQEVAHEAIDGRSGFRFQMRESVFDDGFWYEGAWSYHFYALDPLWMLAEMAGRRGVDLWSEAPLRRMFEAPLRFALPDWTLPAFNDSNAVSVLGNSRFFEIAYGRYGDPLFAAVLGRGARPREALLWGAETLPDAAGAPPRESALFTTSGYAVLRAPEGDHTAILDFGPHGGGHGHYDKLGFVSFARGGTLAVDPGTQPYGAPTHATWDKETIAHNTVTVDEKSQREAEGKVIAFTSAGLMTAVRADAGDSHREAALERTLYLAPEYMVDVFDVRSRDGAEHTFDWAYHNFGRVSTELTTEPFAGFGKAAGYQHLTGTRAARPEGEWEARFDSSGNLETAYGGTFVNVTGTRATFAWSRAQAASGLFSVKMTYEFTPGGGYALYTSPAINGLPVEKPSRLIVKVYGDGSGNRLTLRIHDREDERFTRAVGPIDWTGWKEIALDFSESWTHFSGNNDGVFDLPARAVAFEVGKLAGGADKGEIYADDVTIAFPQAAPAALDFERQLRNLRVRMLGAPGTTVVTGDGLGPDLRVPVPFAVARRKARETRYVTLFEPYGDAPAITGFRVLEDGAIEVTAPGFQDVFRLDEAGVLVWERR